MKKGRRIANVCVLHASHVESAKENVMESVHVSCVADMDTHALTVQHLEAETLEEALQVGLGSLSQRKGCRRIRQQRQHHSKWKCNNNNRYKSTT